MLKLARQFSCFVLIGGIGFFVDAVVLYAGLFLGLDPYSARVVSFIIAATATWYGNRTLTFRDQIKKDASKKEWGTFVVLQLPGFGVNYGLYALLVYLWPAAHAEPILALIPGSAAGLIVNFLINKFVVFRAN